MNNKDKTILTLIIIIIASVVLVDVAYFTYEAPVEPVRVTGSYTFDFTIPEGGVWVSPEVVPYPTSIV